MKNMSYCRFENTVEDMKDCLEALKENGGASGYIKKIEPSSHEIMAIKEMVEIAEELVEELNM